MIQVELESKLKIRQLCSLCKIQILQFNETKKSVKQKPENHVFFPNMNSTYSRIS